MTRKDGPHCRNCGRAAEVPYFISPHTGKTTKTVCWCRPCYEALAGQRLRGKAPKRANPRYRSKSMARFRRGPSFSPSVD